MMNKNAMGAIALAAMLGMGLAACDKAPETAEKTEKVDMAKADAAKAEALKADKAEAPKAEAAKADDKAATGEWKEFKVGETGFVVMAPSNPDCRDQDAGNGMKLHACAAESKETGMIVNVSTMPGVIDPAKIDTALEGAMNGSAKSMDNGEVVGAKDITIGDAKGKDFSIKAKDGMIRSRLLIKGANLVQVVALAKDKASEATKAESEKFVMSLSAGK